jgi:ubiquinone/menaquinone biosynthesis C-methylase UbiE
MSTSPKPHPEHPSTYFVQDRSNQDELKRLHIQDQLMTEVMGGVLPEQPDPASFERVLDVGCGTGNWLIEVAKTYPTARQLAGIDVSRTFIEYARAQAEAEQVSDRVEFQVMDALRMLEFPSGYFDLVNQRAGMSYLRTWDWPKLLQEYQRVARPGGVIRVIEGDPSVESSSPALISLFALTRQAFYQSGHLFTPESDGLTSHLARLLHQHGLQGVQKRVYRIEYHAGTLQADMFIEDMERGIRTGAPFLSKWTRLPDDYEEICQRAIREMHEPNFVATMNLLAVWGNVSDTIEQNPVDSPR